MRALTAAVLALGAGAAAAAPPSPGREAEEELRALIAQDRPYTLVPAALFDRLGFDLPDGGARVRRLAQDTPGGAVDPRALERIPADTLGYRARWIEHRFAYYGLDWDITGLHLAPVAPEPSLPTLAFINGGAANWYEFFLDPLDGPGLAQYLAQKAPVLLVTIPGNYRHGGWPEPIPLRQPQYLLDRELPAAEVAARHALLTNTLIAEGVAQLVEKAVPGPLLIAGHSTSGEIQFLLKDRLREKLRGLSLGWGTGGPAHLRRAWDEARGRARPTVPPLERLSYRTPAAYARNYVGPLNPAPGASRLEVAEAWFARDSRRRPQFKQVLQDLEHRGDGEFREQATADLRRLVRAAGLAVDTDAVAADYFSTLRTPLTGYRRMVSNSGALDEGHWHADPEKARETFLGARFRAANPEAEVRVVAYETPLTHYGHIERPRALAAALLSAVRWLESGR